MLGGIAHAMAKREKSYRGISPVRDEDGVIIAFLVRLSRQGKRHQVYVGVHTHGSIEAAFAHCEQVRDGLERKHALKGGMRMPESSYSKATSRSSTRLRGVSHCHHTHKRSGTVYESFQAQWPTVDGSTAVKKFSIGERSKEEALRLASEARQDGLRRYLRDLQSPR